MDMLRKIGVGLAIVTLVVVDIYLITSLYKHYFPRQTTIIAFSTVPAKGTTIQEIRGFDTRISGDTRCR